MDSSRCGENWTSGDDSAIKAMDDIYRESKYYQEHALYKKKFEEWTDEDKTILRNSTVACLSMRLKRKEAEINSRRICLAKMFWHGSENSTTGKKCSILNQLRCLLLISDDEWKQVEDISSDAKAVYRFYHNTFGTSGSQNYRM